MLQWAAAKLGRDAGEDRRLSEEQMMPGQNSTKPPPRLSTEDRATLDCLYTVGLQMHLPFIWFHVLKSEPTVQ